MKLNALGACLLISLFAVSCASKPRSGAASSLATLDPSSLGIRVADGGIGEGFLLASGGLIRVRTLSPAEARGSFFMAHGYGASSKAFLPLAQALANAGYASVLVDLPGHGQSYGPSGEVGDFREYGEALAVAARAAAGDPAFPRPWLGFGHSLGGIAAYEAVASAKAEFDGLVLAMPLAKSTFWQPLRALSALLKPFSRTLPGASLGRVPISWIDGLAAWNRRKDRQPLLTLPALVFVGGKDSVVNERSLRKTYAALLPLASFIELPGAGHHDLESKCPKPDVLRRILDFSEGLEGP